MTEKTTAYKVALAPALTVSLEFRAPSAARIHGWLDFTAADAWARFIAAKEVEAASLAAMLMVVQSQIKAAKANL